MPCSALSICLRDAYSEAAQFSCCAFSSHPSGNAAMISGCCFQGQMQISELKRPLRFQREKAFSLQLSCSLPRCFFHLFLSWKQSPCSLSHGFLSGISPMLQKAIIFLQILQREPESAYPALKAQKYLHQNSCTDVSASQLLSLRDWPGKVPHFEAPDY